jgi:cell division protein FtsB
MKPILAESPEDLRKEIDRLRRRNEYLQRRVDVLEGEEREFANRQQRNAQRCAQRNGIGFAGCNND